MNSNIKRFFYKIKYLLSAKNIERQNACRFTLSFTKSDVGADHVIAEECSWQKLVLKFTPSFIRKCQIILL